jgi:manganese/zinc/iron transport system substrate-binding protein
MKAITKSFNLFRFMPCQFIFCRLHIFLLSVVGLLLVNCQAKKTPNSQKHTKLNIVCTTSMIADGISNFTKDSATVTALMGEGVDPHLYKATTGDLEKLYEADIVFYNGLHLEGRMGQILEKLGRLKPVIAIAEGIEEKQLILVDSAAHVHDPHIWFDIQNWSKALQHALLSLQSHDSTHSEFYQKNAETYLKSLKNLDSAVMIQISQIPANQRLLITSHDAFSYFGKRYGIEVRGLQGISTVADFGLRDISELVKVIVERKIKAIFVETSVSEKSIEAVVVGCKAQGHEVIIGGHLYTDAMGAKGTPEGTYVGMMKANLHMITAGLK